jgi:hypothetical protein
MNCERKMKNIYNLISDGFSAMGLSESYYEKFVNPQYLYTNLMITIRSNDQSSTDVSTIVLMMNPDGNPYDYQENNTLFTNVEWDAFLNVFEEVIQPATV